jgi:hypothetical protein
MCSIEGFWDRRKDDGKVQGQVDTEGHGKDEAQRDAWKFREGHFEADRRRKEEGRQDEEKGHLCAEHEKDRGQEKERKAMIGAKKCDCMKGMTKGSGKKKPKK